MWKTGRLLLANGSRSPEKMGGVIGKAIKQTSEGIVFEALMRTQKDNPAEPLSYFNGIIKSATTTKGKPKSFKQQERDLKMEQLRREFN